jgi:hypothetical protein
MVLPVNTPGYLWKLTREFLVEVPVDPPKFDD